ncbi:MAG: hypothetical protein M5U28_20515 [Sandaracinaceae bacterium]|nr:hypothetical protein [Sandaracinaceae bacterium]
MRARAPAPRPAPDGRQLQLDGRGAGRARRGLPRARAGPGDGRRGPDGTRDFEPVADLRVGVVSSDMGTSGVTVPTCAQPDFGDDGILRTRGNTSIAGCRETYPAFLEFAPGGALSAFRQDFRCVATLGTGGCGFEQQLEAALKAVTPSDSGLRFHDDTRGPRRAERRERRVLARELGAGRAPRDRRGRLQRGGSGDLRLVGPIRRDRSEPALRRAPGGAAPDQPLRGRAARAAAGPRRAHRLRRPDRRALAIEESGYEAILDDAEMQLRPDPDMPLYYLPACSSSEGRAFPARRIVEAAAELSLLGSPTMIRSICRPSFDEPLRQLLGIVSAQLAPRCD